LATGRPNSGPAYLHRCAANAPCSILRWSSALVHSPNPRLTQCPHLFSTLYMACTLLTDGAALLCGRSTHARTPVSSRTAATSSSPRAGRVPSPSPSPSPSRPSTSASSMSSWVRLHRSHSARPPTAVSYSSHTVHALPLSHCSQYPSQCTLNTLRLCTWLRVLQVPPAVCCTRAYSSPRRRRGSSLASLNITTRSDALKPCPPAPLLCVPSSLSGVCVCTVMWYAGRTARAAPRRHHCWHDLRRVGGAATEHAKQQDWE
jgi:hypothetical protein